MKIIMGTIDPSKEFALKLALSHLKIEDYNIYGVDIPDVNLKSKKSSMQNTIINNFKLKEVCDENGFDYDYLVSIEGGFCEKNDDCYILSSVVIEDKDGVHYMDRSESIDFSSVLHRTFEPSKKGDDSVGYLNNLSTYIKTGGIDVQTIIDVFSNHLNYQQNLEKNKSKLLQFPNKIK